jgi:hypothetical protein
MYFRRTLAQFGTEHELVIFESDGVPVVRSS